MEEIYQEYLDNLAVARSLIEPQVTVNMTEGQALETIYRSAEQLLTIHQENCICGSCHRGGRSGCRN